VAAEYEVNIKINSDKIVTDLNKVDTKIKNLGKSATSQEKSLEKIVDKRARLMNRINELESKGLNVAKLRKQMGKATTEQGRRDLGNAQKEFRVLERTIRLEQSKLKILRAQRQGFPASPIRGIRSMMGSPAQIAASGRQRVSPIGGRIDIAGSPAQMAAIKKMEMAEIRADKNVHFAELKLIQKRQKIELDNVDKLLKANIKSLEDFDKRLKAANAKRLAGNRNQYAQPIGPAMAPMQGAAFPIGGTAGIPGSPEFNRALEIGRLRSSPIGGAVNIAGSPAARRARRQQLEQVGLGAGFPLLFGGGAGSVLGGGLGGLTGSFGAQIALSAIGQQIDQFVAGVVDAGKALTSVGGAFDMMTEKSLFSSDQMQHRIETLIEEGRVTEAAALMTEEMAKKIGGVGMQSLKDLGTEANKMGELFNVLILQVQAFIARALTPLLKIINRVVGGIVLNNQFGTLMKEATGARAKEINEFLQPFTTKVGGQGGKKTKTVISEEGKRLAVEKFGGQAVPEGAEIKPTQLELIRGQEIQLKAAGRGNRDAERERKRMERLMEQSRERIRLIDLQIEKNAKLFGIQEDINEANFYGNKLQSLQLQSEKRILEINYQRDRAIERINEKLPESQRAAEALKLTEEAQQEISMERLDLAYQIRVTERDQAAERAKNMEKALQMQYELNEAVQQQLALADGISSVMGQGMTQAFDALIDGAENWGRALQDIAANVLRDIAKQLIQIYIIEQAIGFMQNLLSPSLPSPVPQGGFGVATSAGKILTSAAPMADGGPVSSGRPYFVGERGPELFVPGASGTIVPNHAMGGANVTVNVDASGTQAQGNQPNAKLLGQAIGAAVQAELIKQKRPGGLLAV
jgi:hypothetical protein